MPWPLSQDYNEAIQSPADAFADPDLAGGEPVVNALGLPVPRSGNFADVYQFTGPDGRSWAVKLFTRAVTGLRERYAHIDRHLAGARLPFAVRFQFLQKGVRVRSQWYPALKMEWVEGLQLNDFVAQNAGKPQYLHALVQMWAKLAGRLRGANLAHADLQHGNVLLVPGATPQKLGLKLIDYDGMWVPALAGTHSGEVGHPNFQHPVRLKEKLYSGDVDRFPHLVIASALRGTLVGGPVLWEKFDNGDNLLFREADFRDPAGSEVFRALWSLGDPVVRVLVGHLALAAGRPPAQTPWLDEVLLAAGGPRLSADDERAAARLLGPAAVPAGAAGAPPAAAEFNAFDFFDDEPPPADEPDRPAVRRSTARPARSPAKKSKLPLVIGGSVAAAVVVIGAVAIAATLGGGPKAGTGKSPEGSAATTVPKAALATTTVPAKGPPPEIRITVVVDGKDELRLAPDFAQWVHHSWQWPPEVKMNSVTWAPERTPLLGGTGITALAGKRVRDPSKVKLTKVRGRGPVTLDATRDVVTVVFDDDGPLGADTYEVVLTFEP